MSSIKVPRDQRSFLGQPYGRLLSRNIVRVDWDDHFANGWRASDDRYQHAIVATDNGGDTHLCWTSVERDFMQHFSEEAKAEAEAKLDEITAVLDQ